MFITFVIASPIFVVTRLTSIRGRVHPVRVRLRLSSDRGATIFVVIWVVDMGSFVLIGEIRAANWGNFGLIEEIRATNWGNYFFNWGDYGTAYLLGKCFKWRR
ncbi:hypothetical protein VNO80_25506 [Phaseolus coccineus]|uniref:Uncharacterized protein n=1 Tax=Phaseolus coccineus TaxID=3886 RepID=A0AAN9LVF1_PHACN